MKITMSSGKVFADLCFSPTESRNLRVRLEMVTVLREFIKKEGLTHTHADLGFDTRQGQPVLAEHAREHAHRRRLGVDLRIKPAPRRVASR